MKYLMIIGDGMADRKILQLGRKTPLQVADTPYMDQLAKEGECGMVKTLPPELPRGSDIAIMSLLGYDSRRFYTGRGPLEASALGIKLRRGEIAFRCNLVTVRDGRLIDYSAGHITTKYARILIETLQEKLGKRRFSFYPGLGYRHIMVAKKTSGIVAEDLRTTPPHDIIGAPVEENLPKGKNSEVLREIMEASYKILANHPINIRSERKKRNAANMVWLWGQGERPQMPSFYEKYGKHGAIISAVDIVKGIGEVIGMEVVNVKGATGFLDTNYAGKVKAVLHALKEKDFVLIHVEAPDEASHLGDVDLKVKAIELFDRKIIGRIMRYIRKMRDEVKIFVGCDHETPIVMRTHSDEAVPFLIWGGVRDGCNYYNEVVISSSSLYFEQGYKLMEYFLKEK